MDSMHNWPANSMHKSVQLFSLYCSHVVVSRVLALRCLPPLVGVVEQWSATVLSLNMRALCQVLLLSRALRHLTSIHGKRHAAACCGAALAPPKAGALGGATAGVFRP